MRKKGTKLNIKMTNDLMFKLVMQKSKRALKSLIASLLGISQDIIVTVEILNPIELGDTIDTKDCILDLKLQINNNEIVNIEMQVTAYDYWKERTILYLGRAYDTLETGEDYGKLKKTYQIGIIDFIPEDEKQNSPVFYGRYMLMEVKNGNTYSDKINIHMLNLKYIKFATEEDIISGLRDWAEFFKASTREEIEELSRKNMDIKEAAEMMNMVSADRRLKEQLAARDKWEHDRATDLAMKKETAEMMAQNKKDRAEIRRERKQIKKEQKDLKKEQKDLKKEQEDLKKEQEGFKKEQEDLKKEQEDLKKEQEGFKKEQEDLKKDQEELRKDQEEIKKDKIEFQKEKRKLELRVEVFRLKLSGSMHEEIADVLNIPVEKVKDILSD